MARKHRIYKQATKEDLPLLGYVVIGGRAIRVSFREWPPIRVLKLRKGGPLGHRMTSTESKLMANRQELDSLLAGRMATV